MHKCLQIPEVQIAIFAHLRNHQGTLAALASTCRSFNETATDILWKEAQLKSLLETIEENEESGHGSSSFTRFLFLATRVNYLTVNHGSANKLDGVANAAEQLQFPIFPHLTKARLSFSEPLNLDFLRSCVLYPNLTEIDIVDISTKNSMEFLEFLPQCTSLSSLHTLGMTLNYRHSWLSYLGQAGRSYLRDTFQRILLAQELQALRDVRLHVLHGPPPLINDLLTISSSSRPISLCMKYDFRDLDESEDAPHIDFIPNPSTTILHKAFMLTSSWDFMPSAIRQMGITTEKLTLCGYERFRRYIFGGSTYQDLIDIISSVPRLSSLTTLRIPKYGSHLMHWLPDGFADESKSLMENLLLLTRLESLDIEIPFVIGLDNTWLAKAAVTWTNLTTLNLTYGSHIITPQMTLEGILPLLESCHLLRELFISLACRPFDTKLISPAAKDNQVRSIVFQYSTLKHWKDVYECLEMMLPSATHISGCSPTSPRIVNGEVSDDWSRLNKKLKVLGLSRTWR